MQRAHGQFHVFFVDQDRDFDLRRRDHHDVDALFRQRAEHLRGHAHVRTHAHAHHGDFRDLGVAGHAGGAQRLLGAVQDVHGALVVVAGHGEREVGFTFDRLVLYDHVHFDVGVRHGSEDVVGHARTVRYAQDGDFGLVAVERDAGDDCLFHVLVFLKRNQGAGVGFFFDVEHRVGQRRQDAGRHAVVTGEFHRAGLQHFRAQRRQFQHFFERDRLQAARFGHHARIGRVHAVHIGENQALVRLHGGGNRHRRRIGTAAAERGDVAQVVHALEAGDDDDLAVVEVAVDLGVVDRLDAGLGVSGIGFNRNLPAGVGHGLLADRQQRHRQQADRDLLAGGGDHVQFARVGLGLDFLGQADQAVGLARHCRRHDHDAMPGVMPLGDTPRHVLDTAYAHTKFGQRAEFLQCLPTQPYLALPRRQKCAIHADAGRKNQCFSGMYDRQTAALPRRHVEFLEVVFERSRGTVVGALEALAAAAELDQQGRAAQPVGVQSQGRRIGDGGVIALLRRRSCAGRDRIEVQHAAIRGERQLRLAIPAERRARRLVELVFARTFQVRQFGRQVQAVAIAAHVAVGMRDQQLGIVARFQQLRHHFRQPRGTGHAQAARAEPVAQQVVDAVQAEQVQFGHVETVAVQAHGQVLFGQFGQEALGGLGVRGAARQALLEAGESVGQRRHDLQAQRVAREARVVVRFVMDVADGVLGHVPVQLPARRAQQRARHHQLRVAQQAGGAVGGVHAGQAGRAGAAQQLQQHGFGLVVHVVGGEQQLQPVFAAQRAQRGVARLAGRFFGASLVLALQCHLAGLEGHAQGGAGLFAVDEPGVGVGADAVVDVEGVQRDAVRLGVGMGQVQQGRGVETATEGDGDAAGRAGLCSGGRDGLVEGAGQGGELLLHCLVPNANRGPRVCGPPAGVEIGFPPARRSAGADDGHTVADLFLRRGFLELAVTHQLFVAGFDQVLGFHALELAQRVGQGALEHGGHGFRIAVGAAQRFVDDLVDQADGFEAVRRQAQRFGSVGRAFRGFPQDRRATFGRDHRIGRVLQHQHRVAHGNGERAAGAAFADDGGNQRHFQFGHHVQVVADGFGLAALFGVDAGEGARGVNEREDGDAEFFRQLHQAHGLAIAFRFWHAEVAHGALLGVAPLLVADHHARLAVEAGQATDDRLVVRIGAVAVQFVEVGEDFVHIVHGVRTLRVARDQRHLPGGELGVDVFGQLLALFGQPVDLLRDVDGRIVLNEAQLFDFAIELGNRLLKIEESRFGHCTSGIILGCAPQNIGTKQIKYQKHLGCPAADATNLHQLGNHRLVFHLAPLGAMDALVLEVVGQVEDVFGLALGQATGGQLLGAGLDHLGRGALGAGDQQLAPGGIGHLGRDLLTDDGARQRGERIVVADQVQVAKLGNELFHDAVALHQLGLGFFPIGADLVRLGKVARLLGRRAAGNLLGNGGVAGRIGLADGRLQELLGRTAQQADHVRQALELAYQRRRLRLVDFGGQVEQHGNRHRRIEIVVHRLRETHGMGLGPVELFAIACRTVERRVQARERDAGVVQVGVRVVERAAVVGAHDEEADHFGIEFFQHVADGEEVAQRLGHLFVIDADKAVVHPVIDHLAAERAFGLGDLVFVVRELQVRAAAVDIEMFAQQRRAHGRALDVPARTALAPLGIPFHFLGFRLLRRFPQHEVERIALAGVHIHALAGAQVVERLAGQAAIFGEVAHRVVDVAVRALVRQVFPFQLLDQRQHLRHVLGGARHQRGRQDAQRARVLVHVAGKAAGQLRDGLAVFHGAADDFIVDIGDVARVRDVVTGRQQPAVHHVERHHHAGVADVAVVINGHAADIHADFASLDGNECLLVTRQRVVNL
uniref:Uncharacterized protein n=1 Tax=Tanacetum cinerariifolium TaxID=118510 RepID=A0A699GM37_TANCI|nr:hypothetical protein [Tanacetum cinerariifolium]